MDKIPEEELGEQRLTIARALIHSGQYDSEQIRRFLFFLKTFVYLENPEINRKFDQEMDRLTGNDQAMGIIETIKMLERKEGFEKGVEQKSHEFVTRLLQTTQFTISEIAHLAGVTEDYVRKVQQEHSLDK